MSKKYRKKRRSASCARVLGHPVMPYLVAFLSFLLICLCAPNAIKVMAVLIIPVCIVICLVRRKTLQEQMHLPLVVLALFILMNFISTFYAASGKFALQEFLKIIVSFVMMLLLLVLTKGEGETISHHIAAILSRCAAFMGIVSIDLLSTRWISGVILGLLQCFDSNYSNVSGVEAGIRMTSMIKTPNVFAGIAGIGVLLSLSLVLSSERGKRRGSHIVCLFINALAFVLAFSMGATGVIAVAFLVYLLLERKERRADLFILMVETLVVVMLGVVLISMTSFDAWNGFQPIPLLCLIAGAAVLCLLDHYVGQNLADKLAEHGRTLLAIIGGLIVVLLIGVVAAYNLTGSTDLATGESLRRSVYPEAGEYTVSAQVTAPVKVMIESQNKEETMMHTSTVLYQGELSEATFVVPEDALVVYFNFYSEQDVHLESVSFSGDVGRGEVPLGYKLLPNFIANRIQGLFANQNAIQRTIFFEDGIKLFKSRPVFGIGLGGYQSAVQSVQSFFYETKYAHNHYIQVLAETGVFGLLLFVGLLAVCAIAILRSRRKEGVSSLVPALGAALVFMAGHAAAEVTFSYYAYLPFAFGVFGLINLCCGEAIALPRVCKKAKNGVLCGAAAILVVFWILLCGNVRANSLVNNNPTFDSLTQAAKMDKYEWANHMLSYVMSSMVAADDPEIQAQANEYAARLEKVNSNTIPYRLASFYFDNGDISRGMAMLEKYVDYVSSNPEAWEKAFDLMKTYETDSESYRAGVLKLAQILEVWNEENMADITLSEEAQALIAQAKS